MNPPAIFSISKNSQFDGFYKPVKLLKSENMFKESWRSPLDCKFSGCVKLDNELGTWDSTCRVESLKG